jgi:Zn-dependent metalloprotease
MKVSRIVFSAFIAMTFFCGAAMAGEGSTSLLGGEHQSLINQLKQGTRDQVRITTNAKTGRVSYIGADPAHAIRQPAGLSGKPTPEKAARGFLSVYGPLFGLKDQAQELQVMRTKQADRGRSFVRFQQYYGGIPVFGGETIVQVDSSSNIISAHSKLLPDIGGDTSPSITPQAAAATAVDIFIKAYQKQYQFDAASLQVSTPELWIYNPLLVGFTKDVTYLVWRIEITPQQLLPIREMVLVDAVDGRVVLHFNQNPTAEDRQIYNNYNDYTQGLQDNLVRSEGDPVTGIADVDHAYDYAGSTYDFYYNHFGRDSLDGAGMTLISTTRYCPAPFPYCPYANAFWNGSQMVYGEGYASADDVVGHEMTHGVTEYESNLTYLNESGAINESLSDIFGEFIDLTNVLGNDSTGVRWLIGEDLPGGAIRSMKNPPSYGNPDKMGSTKYSCSTCDQGGVNTNSGVGNKAAYLMTDGGAFNGIKVTGLGIDKVAQIYYEAQTNILTSTSDYDDLANALWQGCMDLVGGTCYDGTTITYEDCTQVANAVNAVEMMYLTSPSPRPPMNIVQNAGFEDGLSQTAWTVSSSGGHDLITYFPKYAACGDYGAWLGGYANEVDSLYQDITIPADATLAQLQFWYWIWPYNSVWGVHDKMAVEIRDTSDNLLKTVVTFSNRNAYDYWKKSSLYNLLAYKGQTIRLRFYATTTYSTSFFVDDIVLKVAGISTPAVATFSINNNAASTTKRLVTLNNKVKAPKGYTPTDYLASEDPSFTGASWLPYSTKPQFTILSAGSGTKEVFFKVRNSAGDESAAVSDTISALGPAVTSFKISNGAASTTSGTVKLNNVATNSPTGYMASEDPAFGDVSVWSTYSTAPVFTLSPGTGTKTIYFKVQNDFAESAAASDTITKN